jgi:hypothetical protein
VKRLALACCALLLATACGSTVELAGQAVPEGLGPSAGGEVAAPSNQVLPSERTVTTAVAGSAGRSEPGRGAQGSVAAPVVTTSRAVTGPLRIGMVYPDNGAANAALGVATDASNGPRGVMAALVSALNRSGGLAGRKLSVDYYTFDSTSSDYSAQATAACTYFTQDKPVPVVLDLAFGNKFGMASCLAQRGVVDLGHATSDTVADNQVGLFAAPAAMTSDRRYRAVVEGLRSTGYVTGKNKVGVLLEDCAHLQRSYQQTVVPEAKRLGLALVDTEHVSCTTGFSSAGPASASIQSAVLQFRSRGVDRLLIVSDFEQVMLLLLANYAESQGWHPGFMLSSTAQTEVMRANIAAGQWPQLHGMGWLPGLDIDDPHQPLTAVERRCLSLVKQGGVTVSGWQNTYVAMMECSLVFFLQDALQHSAGDARGPALMAGVERLGTTFVAPGTVAGRTFLGPRRHDAPAAVAPFGYDGACSCLKYVGKPFPVS